MNSSLAVDAAIPNLLERLESYPHQRIREDLFELAALFDRVCAHNSDAGLRTMRRAFDRLGAKLLVHIEKEQTVLFPALAAGRHGLRTAIHRLLAEIDSIAIDLADLRRRRVGLDDDMSEARLRLDARLVLLDRHVTQAIDLEHAVFARAVANEDDSAGPEDPARPEKEV